MVPAMPSGAIDVICNYRTCEFTTVSKAGAPQTWPVSALLLDDGRFLAATSIGLPQKAFNVRRNPKVSMLFSEPTGSGVKVPGAVLIQGDAVAEARIETDMMADADLAAAVRTVFERQPAGAFMHSWLGRRLYPYYFVRIRIYVTPLRAYFWASRDFASTPEQLDLNELRRVG